MKYHGCDHMGSNSLLRYRYREADTLATRLPLNSEELKWYNGVERCSHRHEVICLYCKKQIIKYIKSILVTDVDNTDLKVVFNQHFIATFKYLVTY